jgi:hypothetical protein
MRRYRTRKTARKYRSRDGGMISNSNSSKSLGRTKQRGYTISHESSESHNIENISLPSNKPITRRRRSDSHEVSDDQSEEQLKPLTRKEIIEGAWRISRQVLERKKKEHQALTESEHGKHYKRYLTTQSKKTTRKSKK